MVCYTACSVCMALLRSEIGGLETNDVECVMCDACLFLLEAVKHVKEAGYTVQENGLDYTFVQQQQKVL